MVSRALVRVRITRRSGGSSASGRALAKAACAEAREAGAAGTGGHRCCGRDSSACKHERRTQTPRVDRCVRTCADAA